jgi:sugar lactone lactonase YvrE
MTLKPDVVLDLGDELGEGPCWRAATEELLWVDITRGLLHVWRPGAPAAETSAFAPELSAVLPRAGDGLLLAIGHDIVLLDPDGTRRTVATVEAGVDSNRLNDCRCDPQGRLWAGTMSKHDETGAGALYRLVPGGAIEPVVEATTLSNGIGWSPDGTLMYFVDTPTRRIFAFDFDGEEGTIYGRRAFAEVGLDDGLPDGLAVDTEGGVWVALFGGAAVRRYAPDGSLDAVVDLPVSNPTCPAFGGPDLSTLYVTTAKHELSPEQRERETLAGALFALRPGVAGLAPGVFAG